MAVSGPKVTSLEAFEASLGGVRSVALGGMLLENRPSALVRALLRSGVSGLFLTSAPAASWDADVLIGAGRVSRVRIPHISLAGIGLAPAARHAEGSAGVEYEPCDEALLLGGFLAANHRAPVQPLDHLGVNDLVEGNPLVREVGGFRGVGPLTVDVAFLHAPVGDPAGNLVHAGSRWADVLIARAAKRVVVQVDRLVPRAEQVGTVSIPGYLVDEIVEVPFGAHPLGSVGGYVADLDHLGRYAEQVRAGGFAEYLADNCQISHEDYLDRVGDTVLAGLVAEAAA
ncbi:CoA transferase subunit A [Arthrobacter sp. 18067]|uniref:CoA transferase subunit A n=1 Tax=Arthrobacter sp. 18067 TaxID=2681413 RepID=UPI00135BEE8E|nr:CoA-transferase [Arthrobacter sp. 18067]